MSHIIEEFSGVGGDYRGEVFAAELIKNGIPFDHVYFRTASIFKRPTSPDIEEVKLDTTEEGDAQLVVELNREGLYDMLPEGIFHFRKSRKATRDKEDILDEIRLSREEEFAARKFFGPFENEFFHRRLQLELEEQSFADAFSSKGKRALFESVFGPSGALDDRQLLSLLYLLPLAYKIRGDAEKSAYCASLLLGTEVRIEMCRSSGWKPFEGSVPVVGEMALGVDAIVGEGFVSGEPFYRVHVYGVDSEGLEGFFGRGASATLLEFLLPYLFPVQSSYEIRLHLKVEEERRQLSDDSGATYLAFNSYI